MMPNEIVSIIGEGSHGNRRMINENEEKDV